jgi:hypothetical protein
MALPLAVWLLIPAGFCSSPAQDGRETAKLSAQLG